jgi:hypothetical protein
MKKSGSGVLDKHPGSATLTDKLVKFPFLYNLLTSAKISPKNYAVTKQCRFLNSVVDLQIFLLDPDP